MSPETLELLRRLTLNDSELVGRVMNDELPGDLLDEKTHALVRLAAVAAQQAETPSYQAAIDAAHTAGADDFEIVETILAIASLIGFVRAEATVRPLTESLVPDAPSR